MRPRAAGFTLLAVVLTTMITPPCPAVATCLEDVTGHIGELRGNLAEGTRLPDFPDLSDCPQPTTMRDALADGLASVINDTLDKKADASRAENLVLLTDYLKRVRLGYASGGHVNDFSSLSVQLVDKLKSLRQALPVTVPTNDAAKSRFLGLESLTNYLELKALEAHRQDTLSRLQRLETRIDELEEAPGKAQMPGTASPAGSKETGAASTGGQPGGASGKARFALSLLLVVATAALLYSLQRTGAFNKLLGRAQPRQSGRSPRPVSSPSARRSASDGANGKTKAAPDRPDAPGEESSRLTQPEVRLTAVENGIERINKKYEALKTDIERLGGTRMTPGYTGEVTPEHLVEITRRLTRLEVTREPIATPHPPSGEQHMVNMVELGNRVRALENKARSFESQRYQAVPEQPAETSTTPLETLVEIERQLLHEDWERFLRTNLQMATLLQDFESGGSFKDLSTKLLEVLPGAFEADGREEQTCLRILEPVQTYRERLLFLARIPDYARGEFPPAADETKRLLLIRDSSHQLASLRTELGDRLLGFRPEVWCGEEFRELADLFLKTYQVAEAEGRSHGLKEARQVVLEALRLGDLEPIDIVLGKTRFDSSIHMGRSTGSQAGYRDGTILRVVRNGFRDTRSDEVVNQPEVMVNRIQT